MALLDRVKERTGTDISDAELNAMITAISAELDARFGPAGPMTVLLGDPTDPDSRHNRNLRLVIPADTGEAITVIERDPGNTGEAADETTLQSGDFRVLHAGRTLQRISAGPNPSQFWAPMVEVSYTPVGQAAQREEVTIKLIALDLSYRGALRSEKAGDYGFTLSGDISADREAILKTLGDRRGMVMA